MQQPSTIRPRPSAFSLVELSIVLVILGLLVGGILSGQALIRAAQIRSQIAQIQNYQIAVNTFRGKYNYLPGDIPDPLASQLGLGARAAANGRGNGDGLLEGQNGGGAASGAYAMGGEVLTFWCDLTAVGLTTQALQVANSPLYVQTVNPVTATTSPSLSDLFPRAKLENAYLYVWSSRVGTDISGSTDGGRSGNYFGLSGLDSLTVGGSLNPSYISVADAWAIDSKRDDGLPYSGNTQAIDVRGNVAYLTTGWALTLPVGASGGCVNNGGFVGNPIVYSVSYQDGSQKLCAPSFKMY
ncbi:MAG: type II secretion system protein [Rickettsiales bacterium]